MRNQAFITQRDKSVYEYTRADWKRMWGLYHQRKEKLSKLITLMYNERLYSNKEHLYASKTSQNALGEEIIVKTIN